MVHLIQGECRVTTDPRVVFATVLGSCVAACVRDPVAGVGGMNHFLLPDNPDSDGLVSLRYGAFAMELLVNGLLGRGARRERMQAKLFGGSRLSDGLADIGGRNAAFAREFIEREGIAYAGGSLGGPFARRLQFWPVSGRARQLMLPRGEALAAPAAIAAAPVVSAASGEVELF